MSAYDDLLKHAEEFNRFEKIEGHKFEKLAPPAPVKTGEVGWDGKPLSPDKN